MATEKQIMANRRNAKRSTGPRTAAGKSISSRNAFRHGLSRALDSDETTTQAKAEAFARAIAGENPDNERREAAIEAATAQLEIQRVRDVRNGILSTIDLTSVTPNELWRLLAVERYETRARTNRRRASAKIKTFPAP